MPNYRKLRREYDRANLPQEQARVLSLGLVHEWVVAKKKTEDNYINKVSEAKLQRIEYENMIANIPWAQVMMLVQEWAVEKNKG